MLQCCSVGRVHHLGAAAEHAVASALYGSAAHMRAELGGGEQAREGDEVRARVLAGAAVRAVVLREPERGPRGGPRPPAARRLRAIGRAVIVVRRSQGVCQRLLPRLQFGDEGQVLEVVPSRAQLRVVVRGLGLCRADQGVGSSELLECGGCTERRGLGHDTERVWHFMVERRETHRQSVLPWQCCRCRRCCGEASRGGSAG